MREQSAAACSGRKRTPANTDALFLRTIWNALGGEEQELSFVRFEQEGALPSAFCVTDLAAASIAAAGLAVGELTRTRKQCSPTIHIDRRLASWWFASTIKPVGWTPPPAWDPVSGDYATVDGWIRIHANAPHHRAAALAVLGSSTGKDSVTAAVSLWQAEALETAIVAAGGCAAAMRSAAQWASHPQGAAVASEPLIWWEETDRPVAVQTAFDPARPLAGIRVLDLTRVLAGPVATRFLAGLGADVLRIDPPDWNEPALEAEITLGKRCARLDLRTGPDRDRLFDLLSDADVVIHGYRPGALQRLGIGSDARRRSRPGLVDVSLDAYGWSGPWAGRRGFDSLIQMSAGIAEEGRRRFGQDRPTPLPVQALDHATGYIMAAASIRGLIRRLATGSGSMARLSLARTAKLLMDIRPADDGQTLEPPGTADFEPRHEATDWGSAQRLRPPLIIGSAPMRWDRPASKLGSSLPSW